MGSFNRISVVGYLGRDPETRYTPDGTAVCSFSVATTEKRKDEELTTWFNISVWGRSAEACQNWLTKGSQVYVDGRLTLRTYEKKDGGQGVSLDVRANDVQFLGSRNDGERAESAAAVAAQAPAKASKAKQPVVGDDDDSDIPF